MCSVFVTLELQNGVDYSMHRYLHGQEGIHSKKKKEKEFEEGNKI